MTIYIGGKTQRFPASRQDIVTLDKYLQEKKGLEAALMEILAALRPENVSQTSEYLLIF